MTYTINHGIEVCVVGAGCEQGGYTRGCVAQAGVQDARTGIFPGGDKGGADDGWKDGEETPCSSLVKR